MQALFVIIALTGATFLPAVDVVDGKPHFDKSKIAVEHVYKFND